jgi:hypothetical protein
VIFVTTKKGRTKLFSTPLYFPVFESGMDKHPGSATLFVWIRVLPSTSKKT